jgi:hypothetical protein
LGCQAVKLAGDEGTPLALESEDKRRILHAEENETIGCSESANMLVIENERNLSEEAVSFCGEIRTAV